MVSISCGGCLRNYFWDTDYRTDPKNVTKDFISRNTKYWHFETKQAKGCLELHGTTAGVRIISAQIISAVQNELPLPFGMCHYGGDISLIK